MVEREIVG